MKWVQETAEMSTGKRSGSVGGGVKAQLPMVRAAITNKERKSSRRSRLSGTVNQVKYFLTERQKAFNLKASSEVLSWKDRQAAVTRRNPSIVMLYATMSPSFTRRGSMLNVEVSKNHVDIRGISLRRKQTGKDTRRMDFSWTWKEKRKKDKAQITKESLNPLRVGLIVNLRQVGRTPSKVQAKLTFNWVSADKIVLILNRMLKLHQTLATLSSKRPRPTGNSLWRT